MPNAQQQNTNSKKPEFAPLEDVIKETSSKKSADKNSREHSEPEKKPFLLFERKQDIAKPILETRKPNIQQTARKVPKEKTPKARIELPE